MIMNRVGKWIEIEKMLINVEKVNRIEPGLDMLFVYVEGMRIGFETKQAEKDYEKLRDKLVGVGSSERVMIVPNGTIGVG